MDLFVPGRICLFGEHTDWAGQYRRTNGALTPGFTIITGTNQGLYARVKPHPSKLIYRGTLADGTRTPTFELPMTAEALIAEAQQESFHSYIAGVAYQVLTHYRVKGLEIDNYCTDLPVKKGLSSSAAVCVLVARAFNRVYDLKMTVRGEMEFAYRGEITTPSRCGRMDQGCAYGQRPIMMTFDGDRLDIDEIRVGQDLFFVIVDLCAGKDTRKILTDLNRCYPFADSELQRSVQEYLGPISAAITREARAAIERGDGAAIGRLMRQAQVEFDRHLQPACPGQLTAPVLHHVLDYAPIQPYVFGGKGVGSQGDGTAQFIVRDAASQEQVIAILENELHLRCLKLTIPSARGVRKAVIPAAGFGTRLFPASKALKKELFPVIDRDGRAKPIILAIVEEALSAGIEEVGIVVQHADRHLFADFFHQPPAADFYNKLSRENQDYSRYLLDVGHRVTFLEQKRQEGFGHAVWSARQWVGDEPFLLMLGDHLYRSSTAESCARQVVGVFERVRQSVVGLLPVPGPLIETVGCVAGNWLEPDHLLAISEFAEKPTLDYAREHLRVEGLGEDEFLGLFGQYVLAPAIFPILDDSVRHNLRERGEFQLTSALDRLRREQGFCGCLVQGQRFDTGLPTLYYDSFTAFRRG